MKAIALQLKIDPDDVTDQVIGNAQFAEAINLSNTADIVVESLKRVLASSVRELDKRAKEDVLHDVYNIVLQVSQVLTTPQVVPLQ